ncbi:MAG: hypothetical protein FWF57_00650 [Defluviitaleaceae bacterium]|nr:hypothetical protein [Defluviitaleaceae bacterium]
MNSYIFENEKTKILKFHQNSLYTLKPTEYINKKLWVEENKSKLPINDIFINRFKLSEVDGIYKDIFNRIKKIFFNMDIVVTLPIFTVYKNNTSNLPMGCYSFDIENDYFVFYKELEQNFLLEDINMSISLFLDLEKSLIIFDRKAYQEGLLQIGMLYSQIQDFFIQNNIVVKDYFVNEQSFTHDIGINLRKQVLVKNIFA